MSNPCQSSELTLFLDILNDEELELDSDEDVVEIIEVDQHANLTDALEILNFSHGAQFSLVKEDGCIVPVVMPEPEDIATDSDEDEDNVKLQTIRPVTSRVSYPQPGACDVPELAAGSSGRIRGFGCCSIERGGLGVEPLVERFASDEELPVPLREDIMKVTAESAARERAPRAKRAAACEVEEDVSDVDNDYFGSEEFVWTSMDEWNGVKENFLRETPGPTWVIKNAYDAFRSYWDESLLSCIVAETNMYAQGIQSEHFQGDWYDTNVEELLILFAFWMMLGVHKMPTIKSCFSKLPILQTEIFSTLFCQDRYRNINRAFHLANGTRDANDPYNVLYPMGPVIEQLNLKFQQNYTLHQDICIDQGLTLWKCPAGFKQYIKTKSARFGITTYQLCESSTGYLWSFSVETSHSSLSSSVSTVVKLVQPLLNVGHVLHLDNWLYSPSLARYLKSKHTDCVGTLRPNSRNVPAVTQKAPLAEGEFVARQSGDVMVVALQTRHRVTCISTFHDLTQVLKEAKPGRSSQHSLKLIDDYVHGMGGAYRLDHTLEPYLVERKPCTKWTRKLFKRLLNITIWNARILLEQSSGTKIDSLAFRLALVQSLIDHHLDNVPSRPPPPPHNPPPRKKRPPRMSYPQFPIARLTERHFIRRIPVTDAMRGTGRNTTNLGRRQCVWCAANGRGRSKTVYECPQCKAPLCLGSCFEQFHTLP